MILGTKVREPERSPQERRYRGASLRRNNQADLRTVSKMWILSLVAATLALLVVVSTPAAAAKVEAVGGAIAYGQPDSSSLTSQVEAMVSKADGSGYWMATQTGTVVNFGQALHFGDMSGTQLNQPIAGMAATPTGNGYWLVAADGGVFAFGDAPFYGSMGAVTLNRPIVAMLPSDSGRGYWLLAEDGGIFTFGDAGFFGSGPGKGYGGLFVGMIPVTDGRGYSLVHSDGRISPFGISTLHNDPVCDPWPVTDMSIAGGGAVLLRTAKPQSNDPPSNLSAKIDGDYLSELIVLSQSCQTASEPAFTQFSLPLSDPVPTSLFGWRRHPIWGDISMHNGSDFIGPNRTSGGSALAVANGTVLAVLDLVAYGRTVVLDHGDQVASVYAHLGGVNVKVGDVTSVGDALGPVGSTGLSTGVHLHFELRLNGNAKDPIPYLNFPEPPVSAE